ncbi:MULTISPECIES: cytochrome c oxidase subunit II [unclassified Leptolyngbya]|uniref:cytochrome c oxidase subunit II n=1 Tax=unclassified Leptolyngbya TaxID=2650499 RepID=UPI0016857506|nr:MULTISPECIES: cytochrome c oxidase subunit II [unclassified Leptolyngbya]MBD1910009.1 cytochrome c oxidase subunit II [Leptolyngbya sp. FACHB-8]MBD2158822.1 cytochrome c oxidase subunit II [Leptolyngbya sp. FACHB-16]
MRTFNIVLLAIYVGVIILTSHAMGQQAYDWLPIAAAVEAEPVGHLFSFLVTLGTIVFLAVFGVLVYSILFYRAASQDTSDAPPIRGNLRLEITWTVIPILLVIWIATYSYNIYQRMNTLGALPLVHLHLLGTPAYAADTVTSETQPAEQIEVIAKQWSWSFRYPNHSVTSTELHLPVNRPVHLMLQSEDVVHGFFVPNFRIKQDIIPGQTIAFKFTPNRIGQYQLHDSQFSGTYFALMEATVFVDSPERYSQWLAQTTVRPPVAAVNLAISEHTQSPATPMRSNWRTVPPAQPSLVNK